VRLLSRSLVFIFFPFFAIFFAPTTLAAITPFRSANIITTDGFVPYTNLNNCSTTDGNTCDRSSASNYGNLYFRDFGNYDDFGMPQGSTITKVRIRVTGKSSVSPFAPFVGLSSGTIFQSNCQLPSDLWTSWQLNSNIITTQNFVTNVTPQGGPQAVSASCLQFSNFENKNFIWRINVSTATPWSANIDNFEIAFDYNPGVTPTPTPTPSPIPIPTPVPFLDLPWDYESKGLTFNDAALSINSYFDHEYPLLSSGLSEAYDTMGTIINFLNPVKVDKPYSSHDGYDYGRSAKVHIDDPILAAAGGIAIYINSCIPCGNMILIDHGNGYQTRYLHLQYDGLATNIPGEKVHVSAHQQIGKVGATGNVSPAGDAGAHIHFGVFQDKNHDGNFEDNIPDGVTDPFGWQSKDADPWANYSFFYNGQNRTGNTSYYLWKKVIDHLDATLTSNGGVFNTGKYEIDFPQGATNQNLKLNFLAAPIVKTLNNLRSVGTSIIITASDSLGNLITNFDGLFSVGLDFSLLDLSPYDVNTLSIYSSSDGIIWNKEPTIIDFFNKKATTQVDHLTHFALLAERADTTPPVTTALLNGLEGQPYWFRSDVIVNLNAQDNEGGLGVDYILYKMDGSDWEAYTTPLVLSSEGHHKVDFYSADKDENIENVKSIEFDIDKTMPDVMIDANLKTIWPPNGKMIDVKIVGHVLDEHLFSKKIKVEDEYKLVEPTIFDFGQTVGFEAKRAGSDLDGREYTIKAIAEDLSGNIKEGKVRVVVPHD